MGARARAARRPCTISTCIRDEGGTLGRTRFLLLGLFLLASSATARRATAEDAYHVLVFASQTHPKLIHRAHLWATFVRYDPSTSPVAYVHTISWLPAKLKIDARSLHAEPGANLDLHQSLDYVLADRQEVAMWGPYPISPEVYARSLQVKATLESGATQYRLLSPANDVRLANCNEAMMFVGPEVGQRSHPLLRVGHSAGSYVAGHLEANAPPSTADASWLIPALGLDRYPIRSAPRREGP